MPRKRLLVIVVSCVALLAAGGNPITANATENAATSCLMCHSGDQGFAGQDPSVVANRIKSIIDGKLAHPPLGLSNESDEAIAELTKTLTSN